MVSIRRKATTFPTPTPLDSASNRGEAERTPSTLHVAATSFIKRPVSILRALFAPPPQQQQTLLGEHRCSIWSHSISNGPSLPPTPAPGHTPFTLMNTDRTYCDPFVETRIDDLLQGVPVGHNTRTVVLMEIRAYVEPEARDAFLNGLEALLPLHCKDREVLPQVLFLFTQVPTDRRRALVQQLERLFTPDMEGLHRFIITAALARVEPHELDDVVNHLLEFLPVVDNGTRASLIASYAQLDHAGRRAVDAPIFVLRAEKSGKALAKALFKLFDEGATRNPSPALVL